MYIYIYIYISIQDLFSIFGYPDFCFEGGKNITLVRPLL
jgi:hypothetical protein